MRILLVTGTYPTRQMGGAEYQTALLAHGLARRGHSIGFLATNAGVHNHIQVDGITLWELPGRNKVGRYAHQQAIAATVAAFSPDLCYIRVFPEIADCVTICRRAGVAVVTVSCGPGETSPLLLGQHPKQTLAHLLAGETWDYFTSFLAIRQADVHVCNSRAYSETMRCWYPQQMIKTIYNGSPLPPPGEIRHRQQTATTGQVIWVNNFKRAKRPELYLKLAEALPLYRFVMIGARYGRYGEQLQRMIEQGPKNLHYLGALPIEEVNQQIGQSDLLVYTTGPGNEGFGNSYIQAWLRGVPTVSTFELDGLLERKRIGRFAQDFAELVAHVRHLMNNHEDRIALGKRARLYAIRHHRVEVMVRKYERLFTKIMQARMVTAIQHTDQPNTDSDAVAVQVSSG